MAFKKPRSQDKAPRPPGAVPGEARLRDAALNHLARFAATEVGLKRVLVRKIDRWARAAEQAGEEDVAPRAAAAKLVAAEVARRLVTDGAVDDAAFAESRARRLARTGRSARATLAHLAQKGVSAETAAAALPAGEDAELLAALAFCRRRRAGPFSRAPEDEAARRRALAALARGGFAHAVAKQALDMAPDAAEDALLASRA
jgi:regulatory protein